DSRRIRQMRVVLREQYWNKRIGDSQDARRTVMELCNLGRRLLELKSSAVVLEFIFGGCNSLDDYSSFLTPDRLDDLYGNIDGAFVGLGIEMKADKPRGMLLVKVLSDSPAEIGGLRAGEYITVIDGTSCLKMTTDEAAKLLRGPSASRVRLTIHNARTNRDWQHTFVRRSVQVKSVTVVKMIDPERGIGYIQMTGFQKTTPRELKQAIAQLKADGMRAVIWDLRGNPGGLLTASIKVLEQFIGHGVLVETRGRAHNQDFSYRAGAFNNANRLPLVLLVDGDSASASEIVAGAIRDHRRGTIVGRQTYGKWSVQTILPLTNSTGLRLTTARFYSPHGHSLGKIGVRPDLVVAKSDFNETPRVRDETFHPETDVDIQQGLGILRKQLAVK
ncbi:MAG: S41 family peptidase, partial [Planctomycetaceae bacterium]